MHRHFVDRLTDTTAFRCLLLLSALGVLPILAMGALTTVIGGAAIVMERAEVDFAQAVFGLLENAAWKRLVVIGAGTHTVIMERNRMQLLREVQLFLDEPAPRAP